MAELRLDVALAERGLVRSRTQAAKLIAAGSVTVNGLPAQRASALVADSDELAVVEADHYVSRAAHKLIAALDAFAVDPRGLLALDAGVSTGGFSQVLLERGARCVLGVEVGHGQLAPELAADPRLVLQEGINAKALTPGTMERLFGESAPELLVADLSFISLRHVLPAFAGIADPAGAMILLVKPQFEVGKSGVREGIVRDPVRRAEAVAAVMWGAYDLGWGTAGLIPSPIAGSHGNREYLLWLSARQGGLPTPWEDVAR